MVEQRPERSKGENYAVIPGTNTPGRKYKGSDTEACGVSHGPMGAQSG